VLKTIPALLLSAPLALGGGDDVAHSRLPLGEDLLGELRCTACHAAEPAVVERIAPKTAPVLDGVGARIEPRYLRRYLARPHGTKAGVAMPDLLGGMPKDEQARAIDELVHYLTSLGGPFDGSGVGVAPDEMERGRQLYHSVGCVACHAPLEEAWALDWAFWELEGSDESAEDTDGGLDEDDRSHLFLEGMLDPGQVPLGDLKSKTNVAALTAFLREPLKVRRSGRMPSLDLSSEDARAIATYLLREQVETELGELPMEPGLAYTYYEEGNWKDRPDFSALTPKRAGITADLEELPEHRNDGFGFVFEGFFEVEDFGEYAFSTNSDDGSQLYIDGAHVVDNGGRHGMRRKEGTILLEPGKHSLRLTYYEGGGGEGLEVEWRTPGVDEFGSIPAELLGHTELTLQPRTRPLEVDPALRDAGRARFESLGCSACHVAGGTPTREPAAVSFASLAGALSAGRAGCLEEQPAAGLPRYDLDPTEREALRRTVASAETLASPLPPKDALERELVRLRCIQCHRRQGLGGVHPDRRDYYHERADADLGDEGRFPPHLEHTGAKLKLGWLDEVLFGQGRVRPYLETRMPSYGEQNVAALPQLFQAVDSTPEGLVEPEVNAAQISSGRQLVGTDNGLGCIQCHHFAGYPSLGIPAPDLASVYERIQPGWFRQLLIDPASVDMLTRMPSFTDDNGRSPVELYAGDPGKQADAIRAYLSLGASMPLPAGLSTGEAGYELEPTDKVVMCGVFMRDVSPRTVVVGSPKGVHYAFDVENSTLARIWRGRFFNAKGTWHGRAGQLQDPAASDFARLPLESPFAFLEEVEGAWPSGRGSEVGLQATGRLIDSGGYPTFQYTLQPQDRVPIEVEDTLRPVEDNRSALERTLLLRTPIPPSDLAISVARGSLSAEAEGTWRVNGQLLLEFAAPHRARLNRDDQGLDDQTLIVPLYFSPTDGENYEARLEYTLEVQP